LPTNKKSLRRIVAIIFDIIFLLSAVEAAFQYTGVNLSGYEFGNAVTGKNNDCCILFLLLHRYMMIITGVYGTDYVLPSQSEVNYFIRKGMNTFRLPFLWERLQPVLSQPLNETEVAR
jgi:aryl-phospho-beta-D-glucosidase BglC (GH1 family)